MTIDDYKICYEILNLVLCKKSFINIALDNILKTNHITNKLVDTKAITFLCYGVVENNNILDIHLQSLVDKLPKPSICIILKIGIFGIHFMNTNSKGVINNVVDLAKNLGKGGVSGFINAVLRKSMMTIFEKNTTAKYPNWVLQKLYQDLGVDTASKIIQYQPTHLTHIRANLSRIKTQMLEQCLQKYDSLHSKIKKTQLGYYVDGATLKLLDKSFYCIQSLGSMLVVESIGRNNSGKILDLCAAPGGKSIYAAQNNPDANIISCDIHKHRVELIRSYANCTGTTLTVMQNDATLYNAKWENQFDIVMCDVPCSGLGVIDSKPDILQNIAQQSIQNLTKIQTQILERAANYTKIDGKILYSTCTYFQAENEDIVQLFLQNHKNYKLIKVENQLIASDKDGYIKIYPHTHNTQGFFCCVLQRKDK